MINFQGADVRLRDVTTNDTSRIVSWRNTPKISRWFFSEKPVTPEGHERFIANLPPNDRLYIIERLSDSMPVGMIGLVGINKHNRSADFGRFLIEPAATWRCLSKSEEETLNFMDLYLNEYINSQ